MAHRRNCGKLAAAGHWEVSPLSQQTTAVFTFSHVGSCMNIEKCFASRLECFVGDILSRVCFFFDRNVRMRHIHIEPQSVGLKKKKKKKQQAEATTLIFTDAAKTT